MPDASHAGRLVKDVIHEMITEQPGISVDTIAKKLGIQKGLVMTLCNELVRDGLLTKEDSEVN